MHDARTNPAGNGLPDERQMDLPSIQRHPWRFAARLWGLIAIAAAFCGSGCRSLEAPADLASAGCGLKEPGWPKRRPAATPAAALLEPQIPVELAAGRDGLSSVPQPDSDDLPEFHWQHAGIDKLTAFPEP